MISCGKKMTKLVYNVAAISGGALSILDYFYQKCQKDKETNYVFIISIPHFESKDNIRVINVPWVKKSWFHRFIFENIRLKGIIDKYNIDEIISLQNISPLENVECKKTIFLHNALPFTKEKFSILFDWYLVFYKHIIGRIIKNSLKKADYVIVQSNWLSDTLHKLSIVDKNKIEVDKGYLDYLYDKGKKNGYNLTRFFYPSTAHSFKNHSMIIEACKMLIDYRNRFEVYFTISGDENRNIKKIKKICDKYHLPVRFIGNLNKIDVTEFYSRSILVFPSKIETLGLPLLEAMNCKSNIICVNLPYAREVLVNYSEVYYFESDDLVALKDHMKKFIGEIK